MNYKAITCVRKMSFYPMIHIQAWKSLIVVSGSPYRMDITDFANQVRNYNKLPPFNFNHNALPLFTLKQKLIKPDVHISIYAAYLYDSIVLFSKVRHFMELASFNVRLFLPSTQVYMIYAYIIHQLPSFQPLYLSLRICVNYRDDIFSM